MPKSIRPVLWIVSMMLLSVTLHASTAGILTGRITDETGAVIPGAEVEAVNVATNQTYSTTTNELGIYTLPSVQPGTYRLFIRKDGFRTIVKPDIVLRVQENIAQNFEMAVGSVAESITVEGGAPLLNARSAEVGTVIDRVVVENMPLNGRSFHTLIELAPGVVQTPSSAFSEAGQFSVNGQRTNANYFTVDGVSANAGVAPLAAGTQHNSGTLNATSASGGTSNLASVEGVEEFRIQTSSYAAEFGRQPGAQISVRTRSGTNEFHGVLFEYFRNDVLDANDWFANSVGAEQAALRHNDFGGALGGPLVSDKTFFHLSFESVRLRLPRFAISCVPDAASRAAAPADIKPLLDAFPVPNGPACTDPVPPFTSDLATFASGWSVPSSSDSFSLRVDHDMGKSRAFVRYNLTPSDERGRGGDNGFNNEFPGEFETQTLTGGLSIDISPTMVNEFRANWSASDASVINRLLGINGAVVPTDAQLLPSFTSSREATFSLSLGEAGFLVGREADNSQRQVNIVDHLSVIRGAHLFKMGFDYRGLMPTIRTPVYGNTIVFQHIQAALAGTPFLAFVIGGAGDFEYSFNNVSAYVQDTWNLTPRFTLTYGLRWENNPPPTEKNDRLPFTVIGLDDPATMTLAPQGTALWNNSGANFAPRIGAAYELLDGGGLVLRGGFGIFYDLGNGHALTGATNWPYGSFKFLFGPAWPLSPTDAEPLPFSTDPPYGTLNVSDPNLDLPYSAQWNVALEKSLGPDQVVSATYAGQAGRRLIRREALVDPNPDFTVVNVARNAATSDYHSLQLQYRRRMSNGLQALVSHTWSHSIDDLSGELAVDLPVEFLNLDTQRRASSDFDIRHSFSAAVTYEIPTPGDAELSRRVLGDWVVDVIGRHRTGTPIDITTGNPFDLFLKGTSLDSRPNVVPNEPFWLADPAVAGGRRINRDAFSQPPFLENGNLGRNALRGFSAGQVDFSIRRSFHVTESIGLQFRVDMFNITNHPNFANPERNLNRSLFGVSRSMLNNALGGGALRGGFNGLYQVGGPRSIQVALKLVY